MTSPVPWSARLAAVAGPVGPARAIGAGVYLVESDGGPLVVKLGEGVLDEADGLRRLGQVAGAPPVPAVVLAEAGLLVTAAVAQVPRTAGHEERLGRALARLHEAPHAHWGGGSSWIGACQVEASYRSEIIVPPEATHGSISAST